jgi:hypothetical protein
MDVRTKSRCELKERVKDRRAGDGILIYALCEPNGYTINFSVKNDNLRPQSDSADVRCLAKTYQAVHYLLDDTLAPEAKGHHLFMDNLYNGVPSSQLLYDKGILITGTARKNRIPKEVQLSDSAQKGAFRWLRRGNVIACSFMDTKVVRFMTTGFDRIQPIKYPKETKVYDLERRQSVKRVVEVDGFNVQRAYNLYMGGVDIADQYRSYYSSRLKSIRWWTTLHWWVWDTAIGNAYIIHKALVTKLRAKGEDVPRAMSHFEFRERLAEQLISSYQCPAASTYPEGSKTRKRMASKGASDARQRVPYNPKANHFPRKVRGRDGKSRSQRKCVYCRDAKGERKKSDYFCPSCDVGLCIGCFHGYHQSLQ